MGLFYKSSLNRAARFLALTAVIASAATVGCQPAPVAKEAKEAAAKDDKAPAAETKEPAASAGGEKATAAPSADASTKEHQLIPRSVLFGNPQKATARISPNGKWMSYLAPVNGILNVFVAPIDDMSAAKQVTDASIRKLLVDLAEIEIDHANTAHQLEETHVTESVKESEARIAHRAFVLQYVQPGLAGLMDGSVSTLAPLFAAAFEENRRHRHGAKLVHQQPQGYSRTIALNDQDFRPGGLELEPLLAGGFGCCRNEGRGRRRGGQDSGFTGDA